jgi:glycosyltransferase involved in cell wall biosynthesis
MIYYRSYKVGDMSFKNVAEQHIIYLRKLGYNVIDTDIHAFIDGKCSIKDDVALVQPFIFGGSLLLDKLSKLHKKIVIFEVADTTSIDSDTARILSDERISAICLPSTFSMLSYYLSGVRSRLFVVPHGVYDAFRSKVFISRNENIRKLYSITKPKVLSFCLHSEYRKGLDIVTWVASIMKDVTFVIRTRSPVNQMVVDAKSKGADIVTITDEYLSFYELACLYKACDILFSPHRGGAFEMNVLEGLASGIPVVTTGWGCVLDYCDNSNSYLINVDNFVKVFSGGVHCGLGANPDKYDAYNKLKYVIDNYDYCLNRSIELRQKVLEKYTWENTARLIKNVLSTVGAD